MSDVFSELIRTYAAASGFTPEQCAEAADAAADSGVYAVLVDTTTCALTLHNVDGQPQVLASAHLERADAGGGTDVENGTDVPAAGSGADRAQAFLAAFVDMPTLLAAPVPVFEPETDSLGFVAVRPLASFVPDSFADWMRSLEWFCRVGVSREKRAARPMPPAAARIDSVEALRGLFAAQQIPLSADQTFWKLSFPDRVVFLDVNPRSGRACLRSLLDPAFTPNPAQTRQLLAANLALGGRQFFTVQHDQLWCLTPFYPETLLAQNLLPLLQDHLDRCALAATLAAEAHTAPATAPLADAARLMQAGMLRV